MTATAPSKPAISFEDVNNHNANYGYYIPNEEIARWRSLLSDVRIPIERAAGICSAGEVGFFCLLSRVRKELVLVDHSYQSLGIAMLKYSILREYGWAKGRKLLSSDKATLLAVTKPFHEELPDKIQQQVNLSNFCTYYPHYKRQLSFVPDWVGRKAVTKLAWVQFIHGDLLDLIPRGPFDLVYLSNALEHHSRNGADVYTKIVETVRPGGYILNCAWSMLNGTSLVKQVGGTWPYKLVQKEANA